MNRIRGVSREYIAVAVLSVGLLAVVGVSLNPFDVLKNVMWNVFEIFVEAIFVIPGWITVTVVEGFLVFKPPAALPSLQAKYWTLTFPMFFMVLTVSSTMFFASMQLFPDSTNADLDRFMKRVFIATMLLFIVAGPPFYQAVDSPVQLSGYSLGVQFVNLIIQYLLPPASEYAIALDVGVWQGLATGVLGAFSMFVFLKVAGIKQLIMLGVFLAMLGMRMIIVYVVYLMFPLLIALWIVDIGPMKYGKIVAGFAFKSLILVLLIGVIIAALLSASAAIAGEPPTEDDFESTDSLGQNPMNDDEPPTTGGVYEQASEGQAAQAAANPNPTIASVLFTVFSWWGGIWLSIVLVTMTLGSTVNTGFIRQYARAGKMLQTWGKAKRRFKNGNQRNNQQNRNSDSGDDDDSDSDEEADEDGSSDAAPEPDNVDDDDADYDDAKDTAESSTNGSNTDDDGDDDSTANGSYNDDSDNGDGDGSGGGDGGSGDGGGSGGGGSGGAVAGAKAVKDTVDDANDAVDKGRDAADDREAPGYSDSMTPNDDSDEMPEDDVYTEENDGMPEDTVETDGNLEDDENNDGYSLDPTELGDDNAVFEPGPGGTGADSDASNSSDSDDGNNKDSSDQSSTSNSTGGSEK